jgi:Protein of unknown function (DUF1115)
VADIIQGSVALCFTLPQEYPTTDKPNVTLEFSGDVDNNRRKLLRDQLHTLVESLPIGGECLDEIIIGFQTSYSSFTSSDALEPSSSLKLPPSTDAGVISEEPMKVVLVWTHHLLNTAKRKFIISRGSELSLSGISKPGHPGVILVEGTSDNIDTFVRELKSLRWQAIAVKGEFNYEETQSSRLGNTGIVEVQAVADMTTRLQSTGLEQWFLDGIGIRRGAEG